jgi:hypothetical protein
VTTYSKRFTLEDLEELEQKEAAEEKEDPMDLDVDGEEGEKDGKDSEGSAQEEKEKPPPIVRAAVAVARLLKEKSLSKALKPVVFIMKAMTAPTRTWKGPAPELVSEMREIFEIYDKSYWILVFALPGMPKAEALQVVDAIVQNAPNKKGQKATGQIRGALDALLNPASPEFAPVTPVELLVCLHRSVAGPHNAMAAIDYCLQEPLSARFTESVLEAAIQQMLDPATGGGDKEEGGTSSDKQEMAEPQPLPRLLLRLVILGLKLRPALKPFSLRVVGELIVKKIWVTQGSLWKGCVHLLAMTGTDALPLYLQMPKAQLIPLLKANKNLKPALVAHAASLSEDQVANAPLDKETVAFLKE